MRCVSFDGSVSFEGRRFGVPHRYPGKTCRVSCGGELPHIYSDDLPCELTVHPVTWSRRKASRASTSSASREGCDDGCDHQRGSADRRECAASFDVAMPPEELAKLAVRSGMGEGELAALEAVFTYLADKHRDQVIETLLRLSRLSQKAPKAFEGSDFDRIRGRDAAALRKLPALSNLRARKNLAFIDPDGIGKTHLARAYGRECCPNGYKTYCLKVAELRGKLKKATDSDNTSRTIASLVKPSCLIADGIGRCAFDKACTDLFFDVVG